MANTWGGHLFSPVVRTLFFAPPSPKVPRLSVYAWRKCGRFGQGAAYDGKYSEF